MQLIALFTFSFFLEENMITYLLKTGLNSISDDDHVDLIKIQCALSCVEFISGIVIAQSFISVSQIALGWQSRGTVIE